MTRSDSPTFSIKRRMSSLQRPRLVQRLVRSLAPSHRNDLQLVPHNRPVLPNPNHSLMSALQTYSNQAHYCTSTTRFLRPLLLRSMLLYDFSHSLISILLHPIYHLHAPFHFPLLPSPPSIFFSRQLILRNSLSLMYPT